MARIEWDKPQDRTYEIGIEKGVLYVENGVGVPWNGLISVNNTSSSEEVERRYQDGQVAYLNTPPREFESEIVAYTYPDEFEVCQGVVEAYDGIFLDEQVPTYFSMSYQTRVGDAVKGDRRGVKIHLIYNAIATPTTKTSSTLSDDMTLNELTWGVRTAPVHAPGFRPTSHFILDPSRIGPRQYQYVYDILYGTTSSNPRMISPTEIIDIAGNWHILYPSNGTYPSLDTFPGGP